MGVRVGVGGSLLHLSPLSSKPPPSPPPPLSWGRRYGPALAYGGKTDNTRC